MASKYERYFVLDAKGKPSLPEFRHEEEGKNSFCVTYIDENLIEGAFYNECAWFFAPTPVGRTEADAHIHDFDEIVAFFGTNFDDPLDLGGEIEFHIEDEKFILNKSFVAFIPKGVRHCPLIVRKVFRPIFHFTLGNTSKYR